MSMCLGAGPQPSFVPAPRTITDNRSRDAHWSTAPTASADAGSTTTRGTTPSIASPGIPGRAASGPRREMAVSEISASGIRPVDRGELRVAVLVRDDLVAEPGGILEAVPHFRLFVLES